MPYKDPEAKRAYERSPGRRASSRERQRSTYKADPDVMRNNNLKRAYGITVDDYDRLLAQQGGVCAVCGSPPGKLRLAVDHNHDTGQIRGLLCSGCNVSLGMLKEDPDRITALLAYLIATEGQAP